MIEAVIFDMDGVLIDSEPLHYESDKILLNEMGIIVDDNYLDKFVGMTNPEMWRYICKDKNKTTNIKKLLNRQQKIKIELLKKYDYRAINGVIDIISRIQSQKIPIGVASSSSLYFINKVLTKIQLKKYIKRYISGENVPNGKPEPDIFLHMAKLLKVMPSKCLVIEDSRNGVIAAKKAGMRVIGYQNKNSGNQDLSESDIIISDYLSLDISKILVENFI